MSDLFNQQISLSWVPFDSDMIGTPCSATITQTAIVYVLLDPVQALDISDPLPVTVIANTTVTDASYIIG